MASLAAQLRQMRVVLSCSPSTKLAFTSVNISLLLNNLALHFYTSFDCHPSFDACCVFLSFYPFVYFDFFSLSLSSPFPAHCQTCVSLVVKVSDSISAFSGGIPINFSPLSHIRCFVSTSEETNCSSVLRSEIVAINVIDNNFSYSFHFLVFCIQYIL